MPFSSWLRTASPVSSIFTMCLFLFSSAHHFNQVPECMLLVTDHRVMRSPTDIYINPNWWNEHGGCALIHLLRACGSCDCGCHPRTSPACFLGGFGETRRKIGNVCVLCWYRWPCYLPPACCFNPNTNVTSCSSTVVAAPNFPKEQNTALNCFLLAFPV